MNPRAGETGSRAPRTKARALHLEKRAQPKKQGQCRTSELLLLKGIDESRATPLHQRAKLPLWSSGCFQFGQQHQNQSQDKARRDLSALICTPHLQVPMRSLPHVPGEVLARDNMRGHWLGGVVLFCRVNSVRNFTWSNGLEKFHSTRFPRGLETPPSSGIPSPHGAVPLKPTTGYEHARISSKTPENAHVMNRELWQRLGIASGPCRD